jgi:hypothetical protein
MDESLPTLVGSENFVDTIPPDLEMISNPALIVAR